jgi:hypothetical protein
MNMIAGMHTGIKRVLKANERNFKNDGLEYP